MIIGAVVEYLLIHKFQFFTHTQSDFLGLPLWLPGLYLNASLVIESMDQSLTALVTSTGS
jgi:hypothetical protein